MAVVKKPFVDWCKQFGIDTDKAASIAEAAEVYLDTALTEAQFRRIAPQTVEDFLKKTSGIKKDERPAFLKKFGLAPDASISEQDFATKLEQFKQGNADAKQPGETQKKAPRLRVTGCTVIYNHREYPDGKLLPADLPANERGRLLKLGAVKED